MKIITKITLLSFFVLILNGCSSHDISKINDNGEWVDIQSAPLTCGYILHDDKIYGIPFDDVEAYDEEKLWVEDIGMTMLLDKADPATFKVNLKNNGYQPYAKDKNYVFCPENLSYLEFEEGTSCPYSETYIISTTRAQKYLHRFYDNFKCQRISKKNPIIFHCVFLLSLNFRNFAVAF